MNKILPWKRWLPLLLLVLLVAPVGAAQVEDPAGLENLRKTAESGDAEAMLELGILYEFGYQMPDNKAPALAWYRLAAEAGNAKAASRMEGIRAGMSPAEVEQANKLYGEYAASVRRPAPPATAPAPSAPESPPEPAAK
jgi:TPR repeat protein